MEIKWKKVNVVIIFRYQCLVDNLSKWFDLLQWTVFVLQKWVWGSIQWWWGWRIWRGRTKRRQKPGKETITHRTTIYLLRRKFTSRARPGRLRDHFQAFESKWLILFEKFKWLYLNWAEFYFFLIYLKERKLQVLIVFLLLLISKELWIV